MSNFKAFLKRKDITVTWQRYGIEALGAMAQGLFCSLLIGTIIKTLGTQLGVQFITDIGTYAMAVSGPAMAVAIGYALKSPPMVLFSLAAITPGAFDWIGLALIAIVLPAVLSLLFNAVLRKLGWVHDGDMKLS